MSRKDTPSTAPRTKPVTKTPGKGTSGAPPPPLSQADRRALTTLAWHDPHALLGMHPTPAGLLVRSYRPDAVAVHLLRQGMPTVALHPEAPPGLFGVLLPKNQQVTAYRLRYTFADGNKQTLRDAYAFLPTLGEVDLHLFGEGTHECIHEKLGAHPRRIDGVRGVAFAVWAPNARGVSVVGDFNGWDGRCYPMRSLGSSGIWELFIPAAGEGDLYKFEVRGADGKQRLKADPFARATELPPGQASRVYRSRHRHTDRSWMRRRAKSDPWHGPMSIYELHLGSWRRDPAQPERLLSYRELAPLLAQYVTELGFTHVEFMPIMEHPFGGSWGYQVSGYFAPTARFGEPDDLRFLIDTLHEAGIGVILDWVPAHFPKDDFALARFDGTALFEHLDPRKGTHPDWDTYIFNYERNEVRNFLVANALYWLEEFHVDGLRMDAVASMLYLDYSRKAGEWVPNRHGGRENLEAVDFLKQVNELAHARFPNVLMVAEESTAYPGVSRPLYAGGLGFGFKWNMGWMHDTLEYFSKAPVHRRYHHKELTFGLIYAWSENFVLPFSHDEVVHGKGSLYGKMPGDRWQKFANLRSLYAHMWAHPGRQLLFMGCEFGQPREWNHDRSLDWHLLEEPDHGGLCALVRDLNRLYRAEPALWRTDIEPSSFQWLDSYNADENVLIYLRRGGPNDPALLCASNFSAVPRHGYRVGVPQAGHYTELLNTDAPLYGGGGVGNLGAVEAKAVPLHDFPCSMEITLPPLATVWLRVPE